MNAVRELATDIKAAGKGRENERKFSPFISVQIKKYMFSCLCHWCPCKFCVGRFMDAAAQEFVPVVIMGNLAPSADEVGYAPKKKNYRPSLAAWMVAWDRWVVWV